MKHAISILLIALLVACAGMTIDQQLDHVDSSILAIQDTVPSLVENGNLSQTDAEKLLDALSKAHLILSEAKSLAEAGDSDSTVVKIDAVISTLSNAKDASTNESTKQKIGNVISALTFVRSIVAQQEDSTS